MMDKSRILVVEDEALIAASLARTLSSLGYTVPEPVSTGEGAISVVTFNPPDLVLMDIELIGPLNGIETAEKIHAIAPVPVVYLTAFTDDQRLKQARLTQPYGYLVKPVQTRELHATIQMALYKHGLDRKLRESEDRYRSVVTQAGEAIAIFDCETKQLLEVNPAFKRLFGYTDEEIPALTLYDIMAHKPEDFNGNFRKIIAERQYFFGEKQCRCKDRSEFFVEMSAGMVERDGKPALVCVIAHDVTERKRAEQALVLANKKLNLLGSITRHDVLNKMTVLLGFMEHVKRKLEDSTLLSYLEKAMQAARDIRAIIEFTRTYQNLGLDAAVWQKIDPLLFHICTPEVQMVATNLENLEIFADPMLGKVFDNLSDNAVRHGERVNTIEVSFKKTTEGLTLIWEDNGVGIPANEKEQIFLRGFGKHTGLGLFLVREILDITGISIKETGEKGKGARFEMAVPRGMWRITGTGGK